MNSLKNVGAGCAPFYRVRTLLLPPLLVAGFLATSPALADEPIESAASDAAGEVVITDKARTHFAAGVNLLQDPAGERYEEAYQQFKAAYEDSPSWKILGNLGLTAMHLERYGEAIDAFTVYLKVGADTLSEEEVQQFQRDLETLQASVSTLEVRAPAGSNLTDLRKSTRGEDVKNYYTVPETGTIVLRVRPGEHKVSAESEGKSLGTWPVRAESQRTATHVFEIEASAPEDDTGAPPEPGTRPNRIPAYVAFGVGGVGVAVGVVFATMYGSQNKKGQNLYDSCLETGDCGSAERTTVEDHDKNASTAGTISLVSFGVGAVGVASGVALWIMGGSTGERPLEAQVGKVRLSPLTTGNQFGVAGTF